MRTLYWKHKKVKTWTPFDYFLFYNQCFFLHFLFSSYFFLWSSRLICFFCFLSLFSVFLPCGPLHFFICSGILGCRIPRTQENAYIRLYFQHLSYLFIFFSSPFFSPSVLLPLFPSSFLSSFLMLSLSSVTSSLFPFYPAILPYLFNVNMDTVYTKNTKIRKQDAPLSVI